MRKHILGLFVFAVGTLVAAGSLTAASVDCETALSAAEVSPEKQFLRLYCHAQKKQYAEAGEIAERLKEKVPELRDYLLYYEGLSKFSSGDRKTAEDIFRKILSLYPDSPVRSRAREELAGIYAENGKYIEAEKIYSILILETESRWTKALYLKKLGEIKEKRGLVSAAEDIFEKIWTEHPEVSFSDHVFEFYSGNKKSFSPAPAQFEKRGRVFFNAGNWEKAVEAFSQAAQTRTVRTKTAISLYRLKRYQEALEVFSKIDSPQAFYWKGLVLQSMEEEKKAVDTFVLLHKLNPKSRYARKSLFRAARLHHLAENSGQAEKLYRKVIKNHPGSEEALESSWNLGWILYTDGEYEKARESFSAHAWESGENRERFLYWYAAASEKADDKPGALFALGKLAESPEITYYSFLAKIRLKEKPSLPATSSEKPLANPFGDSPAVAKFLFFSKAGLPELALAEAAALEKQAKTKSRKIYLSRLYSQAGDYKNSVRLAEPFSTSPRALRFSFPTGFEDDVKMCAKKYELDEFLVYSLIREESRFNTQAVSVSDARGLMQLLPQTAVETAGKAGFADFSVAQLFSPDINIELGCLYLSMLVDTYGHHFAVSLAGYNGGPTMAAEWYKKNGNLRADEFVEEITYEQSRNYVKKVIRSYAAYHAVYGAEKDQFSKQSFEKFLRTMSP